MLIIISYFIAIKPAWRFQGDGVLSFNPLLRPIQLPWLNALSVRTMQKDAFLMSIQVGQNSSAVLSVSTILQVYNWNLLVCGNPWCFWISSLQNWILGQFVFQLWYILFW